MSWFNRGQVPIRDAFFNGCSYLMAYIKGLMAYVHNQTRVATATDGFLDLIAQDFFGAAIQRAAGQTDNSFRTLIQASLFQAKATRAALIAVLTKLTGRPPVIIEPWRPPDTGGYGMPEFAYGGPGYYGSLQLPYQTLVRAFRPTNSVGLANVAGYNSPRGAYTLPSYAEYASADQASSIVEDQAIYNAVNSVRPVCATIWVNINN